MVKKEETAASITIAAAGVLIIVYGVVTGESACLIICYDYVILGALVLCIGIVVGLVSYWHSA